MNHMTYEIFREITCIYIIIVDTGTAVENRIARFFILPCKDYIVIKLAHND